MQRDSIEPDKVTTAVFYSISNCQRGLAGVSFGNFLIKQVVRGDFARESRGSRPCHAVAGARTLPAGSTASASRKARSALSPDDKAALEGLDRQGWWQLPQVREPMQEPLLRAAAWYYLNAKNRVGLPADAVARFHLGNGARLERLNWLGDGSENGISQSYGLMVNYLYDLEDIEKNHEAYVEGHKVVASSAVRRLLRNAAPADQLPVPIAG